MTTLKEKAIIATWLDKGKQNKMTFSKASKVIESTDTATVSHPENKLKRRASKVTVTKPETGKRKTSKRKLSVAGKQARAERLLREAQIALRKLELENDPVMLKMTAQLESIKPVLKLKKAELAKAREAKADKLMIAKLRVSVLTLEAEQAKLKTQIDNCINPKPAKPATKTDEDKLSMTNLVKLSVSQSYSAGTLPKEKAKAGK